MAFFKNKLFKLVIAIVLLFAMVLPLASCDFIFEILDILGEDPYEDESYEVPEGTAEFHFIDIDQGDAILIMVDGKAILIDTGEGISEENLPLVWDRYYKIDKVHKRAVLGTGLGLSIVKNVLMLHNSRFGVSSELGKGSTFWFELKIVESKDI